jgi:hypothetical protein
MKRKVNVADDMNPAVKRVSLESHLPKKRITIILCKVGSKSYFRGKEFKPPHEVLYGWCLSAESKGFPLPFQCGPGLNQKVCPKWAGLSWAFQLQRIQDHHLSNLVRAGLQACQGVLHHATNVVAPIQIKSAHSKSTDTLQYLPCCNGNNPPWTMGKGWEGLLPSICNTKWESLVLLHSVLQYVMRERGSDDRDRIGRMMEPNFP